VPTIRSVLWAGAVSYPTQIQITYLVTAGENAVVTLSVSLTMVLGHASKPGPQGVQITKGDIALARADYKGGGDCVGQ
jgi:hypothetical protein